MEYERQHLRRYLDREVQAARKTFWFMVDQVEARYRARGLRTVFRLANEACFDSLRRELARRGYQAGKPVLVQVAPVLAMAKPA